MMQKPSNEIGGADGVRFDASRSFTTKAQKRRITTGKQ